MTADVIIYDQYKSWSPSILASGDTGRGVGGWEVFMVQLAEGLARQGLHVEAHTPRGQGPSKDGVIYAAGAHTATSCRVLITGRESQIPPWIRAERLFTACVDDPTSTPRAYDHLRGRSVMVHLSEWQRSLYAALGHEHGLVIPSMIDDWIYSHPTTDKVRGRFVCVSAWNKGTRETLAAWRKIAPGGELLVGSPYGFPPDAYDQCARAGARWLGLLTPVDVVRELAKAEAVFRVCVAPETFGVTNAIAEVVGTRVHCLCVKGLGAAREALASPYLTENEEEFAFHLQNVISATPKRKRDYSVASILPQWLAAIGEEVF